MMSSDDDGAPVARGRQPASRATELDDGSDGDEAMPDAGQVDATSDAEDVPAAPRPVPGLLMQFSDWPSLA